MTEAVEIYSQYLAKLKNLIDAMPVQEIARAVDILLSAYQEGHTIFTFGNGGSAALASHMAADLGKATHIPGPLELAKLKRLKVMALNDCIPLLTAWSNDASYEIAFAAQLENFVQPGDVAFGVSGSGNSPNVLRALELARKAGATTVGFTGCGGGKMKALLDCAIVMPSDNMQLVEDAHVIASHLLLVDLRVRFAALAGVKG